MFVGVGCCWRGLVARFSCSTCAGIMYLYFNMNPGILYNTIHIVHIAHPISTHIRAYSIYLKAPGPHATQNFSWALLFLSLIQGGYIHAYVIVHILPKMRREKGVCVILFVIRLVSKVHCAPSPLFTMHHVSHACKICVNLVK
jgi:hypothetical protein